VGELRPARPEPATAFGIIGDIKPNDRGATLLPAKVTDRIAPGVVSIREGAWFTPDERGDDGKGCANVLTDDRSAPSGATTYNTCLVQVEPAPEQG
jgi:anaerobic dimethyl sulfoxide reductase subunit A